MSAQTVSERCRQEIGKYDLLRHPFYVAWSAGRLPVAALRAYACQYGAFIRTIGAGWARVGEEGIARVEEGHAAVWERTFAAGLETSISEPESGGVADLVAAARSFFTDEAAALGALYAFELQQPHTAQSKRQGLQEHYGHLPAGLGEYFRLHEADDAEPALLASRLDALDEGRGAQAVQACKRTAAALYAALTDVYAPYAAEVAR